jgi:hypothetical protein
MAPDTFFSIFVVISRVQPEKDLGTFRAEYMAKKVNIMPLQKAILGDKRELAQGG